MSAPDPDELYFIRSLGGHRVHVVRGLHTPTHRAIAGQAQWLLDVATGYRLTYCGRGLHTGPTGQDAEQLDTFPDMVLCVACRRVFAEAHGEGATDLLFAHPQP